MHYLICGDGPEANEMRKLIKKYKIDDKVTITGFVSNELIATGISLSDIVVMPSLHEEFGSLILELACYKKPIIATNVGGIPENIINMNTGILVDSALYKLLKTLIYC